MDKKVWMLNKLNEYLDGKTPEELKKDWDENYAEINESTNEGLITSLYDDPDDNGTGLTVIHWTDEAWKNAILEQPHYSDDESLQKKFEFAVKRTGMGRVMSALCATLLDFQLKAFIEAYFENNQLWTEYMED